MRLYEFRMLCQQEQIDVLHLHAVYVGKRKENEQFVVLYQLEHFYVEIFYRRYRSHVDHLSIFTSTDQLQPYLEQIDVEELIKCTS